MVRASRHQCLIYEGPPSKKLPILATLIRQNIDHGYRCLYMNSAPMVMGIRFYLSSLGMHVADEVAKGRLILSSEPPFPGDGFDIDSMLFILEDTLDQALKDGYKGLWATGDMAWEFDSEKDFSKLLEYEWRLEELFHKRSELRGVCQYHRDTLPNEVMRQGLLAHHAIIINQTLSQINPHYIQSGLSAERRASNRALDEVINVLCQIEDIKH